MRINDNIVLVPKTYQELTHQAKRILEAKYMLPDDKKKLKLAEIEAIIQIGQALGLTPWQSMQAIMFVRGQATVWGDFLVGLVWASGKMKSIDEKLTGSIEGGDLCAICTVSRVGGAIIERSFSMSDAKKAGLWGKGRIWPSYPKRMLSIRARSWALRDCFGDVTKGLVAVEEAVDYGEGSDAGSDEINKIIKDTLSESESLDINKAEKEEVQINNVVEPNAYLDAFTSLVRKKALSSNMDEETALAKVTAFLDSKKASNELLMGRALSNFDTFWNIVFG